MTTQDGLLISVVAEAVIYQIESMLIKTEAGIGTGTVNAVVIGTGIGKGIKSGIEIETEGMIMTIVPGIVEEIMRGVAMIVVVTIEKVVLVGAEVEAGAGAGAGAEAEAGAGVKMCKSITYKEIVTAYLKMGARKRHLHPAIWLNSEICMVT